MNREAVLQQEIQKANDLIDAAYWRFCRMARALPPVLAVPDAYKRRTRAQRALDKLRARRR